MIARVRANGAKITVDNGKLNVVNSNKLPDGALDYGMPPDVGTDFNDQRASIFAVQRVLTAVMAGRSMA